MPKENRRLAAIIFADIVGYTAMMQEGETFALSKLSRFQSITHLETEKQEGEIIKSYGDGCLILFPSTVGCGSNLM